MAALSKALLCAHSLLRELCATFVHKHLLTTYTKGTPTHIHRPHTHTHNAVAGNTGDMGILCVCICMCVMLSLLYTLWSANDEWNGARNKTRWWCTRYLPSVNEITSTSCERTCRVRFIEAVAFMRHTHTHTHNHLSPLCCPMRLTGSLGLTPPAVLRIAG